MTPEPFPHYIEFRHVSKSFDHPVLKDIGFYVDSGKTLAVIGRSGVGKSVTLSHIMGFIRPDAGQVIVAHADIANLSERELKHMRK
ncbi:MAG: ATP-binding cassette domain-containing protein, partial [Bryobacteraceae bacterium]